MANNKKLKTGNLNYKLPLLLLAAVDRTDQKLFEETNTVVVVRTSAAFKAT